jgi:tetratricopeptide (TPR) repeat protein
MKLLGICLCAGLLMTLAGCPNQALNDSRTAQAKGNKELGAKQLDSAIADFQKATARYHDNHLAWYGLGGAYAEKGDWTKASEAFAVAVQIADDQPMYQMWYGVSLYNKAVADARDDQARRQNKKPEEITDPDLSGVNFDTAMQHLQAAIKLNADMWRAHYFLGKIYEFNDKPKDAAGEFTKAITADPRQQAPYVALSELYLKWDDTDLAIKVAQQGTVNVVAQTEVSNIWFDLGRGYDDKRMDNEAIDAYTKAIDASRDDHKALFQRGQAYYRKGDYTHAKHDLEDFSKSGGASLAFDKQEASRMLMDISSYSG